ncbi:MAG: EamA family transporter [Synergistaceae bacterium]|nr:EamA family transporter [Synergistaceae bacterium]
MELWLIYALLSAITAAFVAIFGKIGLQGIDSGAATAIRAVIMAIFLTGVALFQGKGELIQNIVRDRRALLWIALSGIAGALSWLFYFLSLKYGKVSQVAPVDKLSVVIAAVLAVIFLHERISFIASGGIVMITAGVILVALG